MIELELIILISAVLALASIVLGVVIVLRCSGKLKISIIFLIAAVFVFFVQQIVELIGLGIGKEMVLMDIISLALITFILIALINIKQMIDKVVNHYIKVDGRIRLKK